MTQLLILITALRTAIANNPVLELALFLVVIGIGLGILEYCHTTNSSKENPRVW